MKLSLRRVLAGASAAFVLSSSVFLPASSAQTERQRRAPAPAPTASAKQLKEASKKAENASEVFDKVMEAPDRSIPRELRSPTQ